MASITLKNIPDDLHAQLKAEAGASFRSLTQEVLSRIERSFAMEEQMTTAAVNSLIEKALNSGPAEPLTREKFFATHKDAIARVAGKRKAA